MSGYYSILEEAVPKTVTKFGHRWERTGVDGQMISATRSKKQAEEEAAAYTRPNRTVPHHLGGVWRWKAIIVPYHAKKDRLGWHKKGEKFYLVYIRKYRSKN